MQANFKPQIEEHLVAAKFHPDLYDSKFGEMERLKAEIWSPSFRDALDSFLESGNLPACQSTASGIEKWESGYYAMDLMREKYFKPRVSFLNLLLNDLANAKDRQVVVDLGCGRGQDSYVLNQILGNQIDLYGVEPNAFSREAAQDLSPNVPFFNSVTNLPFNANTMFVNFMALRGRGSPKKLYESFARSSSPYVELDGQLVIHKDLSAHDNRSAAVIRGLNPHFAYVGDAQTHQINEVLTTHLFLFRKQ